MFALPSKNNLCTWFQRKLNGSTKWWVVITVVLLITIVVLVEALFLSSPNIRGNLGIDHSQTTNTHVKAVGLGDISGQEAAHRNDQLTPSLAELLEDFQDGVLDARSVITNLSNSDQPLRLSALNDIYTEYKNSLVLKLLVPSRLDLHTSTCYSRVKQSSSTGIYNPS